MVRSSCGNLSFSSLNMKMLNRWSKKLHSLLQLSLTDFHSSSNNTLILALREGQTKKLLLFFVGKKWKKLRPWYIVLDISITQNHVTHMQAF